MSTALQWKAALCEVKWSSIHLSVFSLAPHNDTCAACTCTLAFSLSRPPFSSLSMDKFYSFPAGAIPLCHQTPPLALSLSLFPLTVLNLFIALHLPSPSLSHAARFFHLVAFIFYPFIFLRVSPLCFLLVPLHIDVLSDNSSI